MSRKAFVESVGAGCLNWQWSWSFVNHEERFVIFGAWDRNTSGQRTLILAKDWQTNDRGRKNPGYKQSREHVRLVEEERYTLKTFPMKYSDARQDERGNGPATIGGFEPVLTERKLARIGDGWYASGANEEAQLAEELDEGERYEEGTAKRISINAFERSAKARAACVRHHGIDCAACGLNFERKYGSVGEGFIHVHHIVPIGTIGSAYEVDPKSDLVPVCANCHAMIHRVRPPLTVEKLKEELREARAQAEELPLGLIAP